MHIWETLLAAFLPVFNAPSFVIFIKVTSAWVICPGRRTITRVYNLAEPFHSKAHDAYHRFFREADWQSRHLWKILAELLITALCECVVIVLDDLSQNRSKGRRSQLVA